MKLGGLWVAAATVGICCLACGEDEQLQLHAALGGPSGMAAATGADGQRFLFIANTALDTVQVVRLGTTLQGDVDFMASAAQYFPLNIKVGPHPSELAATPDGRYVLVLNGVRETIVLIDATTTELVKGSDNLPVALHVGGGGAHARGLTPAATGCAAPCVGRFHLALSGLGAVLTFEVREGAGGEPELARTRLYDVGGAPTHVAVRPDGDLLFASDASSHEVVRLDLATGLTERLDVGATPGALAVSTLGDALVVARQELRDVAVVSSIASAQWGVLDAQAPFAPVPRCLDPCDAGGSPGCAGAHPADRGICLEDAGLAVSGEEPYEGIYLGRTVTHMVAFGTGLGHPALRLPCSNSPEAKVFVDVVAVASTSGTIDFIGLRADGESVVRPERLDLGFCRPPEVRTPDGGISLEEVVDGCPRLPGLPRFSCVKEGDSADGVGMARGQWTSQTWRLSWEGVLALHNRAEGGGEVVRGGTGFRDSQRNFLDGGVEPGDKLEIVTEPLVNADCAAALEGGEDRCLLERRIARILENGEVELERPLPTSCLPEDASVVYRIRVGDAFMVYRGDAVVGRVRPGERVGLGGDVAVEDTVMFQVRDREALGLESTPAGGSAQWNACDHYDEFGAARPPASAALSRNMEVHFSVFDPYVPLVAGQRFDMSGRVVGKAGRVPGGMILAPRAGGKPALLVSYSGTDTVLGFVPFDPAAAAGPFLGMGGDYRILQ